VPLAAILQLNRDPVTVDVFITIASQKSTFDPLSVVWWAVQTVEDIVTHPPVPSPHHSVMVETQVNV